MYGTPKRLPSLDESAYGTPMPLTKPAGNLDPKTPMSTVVASNLAHCSDSIGINKKRNFSSMSGDTARSTKRRKTEPNEPSSPSLETFHQRYMVSNYGLDGIIYSKEGPDGERQYLVKWTGDEWPLWWVKPSALVDCNVLLSLHYKHLTEFKSWWERLSFEPCLLYAEKIKIEWELRRAGKWRFFFF